MRAEDLDGHARVRAASAIPVQTGENWWFPRDMQKALAAGACDYAMPDIMKIGGVTGWLQGDEPGGRRRRCRCRATSSWKRARISWR